MSHGDLIRLQHEDFYLRPLYDLVDLVDARNCVKLPCFVLHNDVLIIKARNKCISDVDLGVDQIVVPKIL